MGKTFPSGRLIVDNVSAPGFKLFRILPVDLFKGAAFSFSQTDLSQFRANDRLEAMFGGNDFRRLYGTL